MQVIDARLALVRHALMIAEVEAGTWYSKPIAPRISSAGMKLERVSEDVREMYDYELTEHTGRYLDAGLDEREADRLALDDFGCVEFWDFTGQQVRGVSPIGEKSGRSEILETCPRCESIGHVVEACPFLDDMQTRKLAVLRRERRAGRKERAA